MSFQITGPLAPGKQRGLKLVDHDRSIGYQWNTLMGAVRDWQMGLPLPLRFIRKQAFRDGSHIYFRSNGWGLKTLSGYFRRLCAPSKNEPLHRTRKDKHY